MANYVKITDYQAKDSLTSGDPAKIIQGAEINDEFNAIQTAIASKADSASPTFTGNPTTATQPFGNNSTRIASTAFVQQALQALYPVGTIYTTVVSTNPASIFGFGTWVAFATGRTLIGIDTGDTAFDSVEETGGSKDAVLVEHTHAISTNGSHTHDTNQDNVNGCYESAGCSGSNVRLGTGGTRVNTKPAGDHTHTISSTGVSATNANLPPYITVYFWKRTV
jgi:hypothetical protein